jgi:hypothetical protein
MVSAPRTPDRSEQRLPLVPKLCLGTRPRSSASRVQEAELPAPVPKRSLGTSAPVHRVRCGRGAAVRGVCRVIGTMIQARGWPDGQVSTAAAPPAAIRGLSPVTPHRTSRSRLLGDARRQLRLRGLRLPKREMTPAIIRRGSSAFVLFVLFVAQLPEFSLKPQRREPGPSGKKVSSSACSRL